MTLAMRRGMGEKYIYVPEAKEWQDDWEIIDEAVRGSVWDFLASCFAIQVEVKSRLFGSVYFIFILLLVFVFRFKFAQGRLYNLTKPIVRLWRFES